MASATCSIEIPASQEQIWSIAGDLRRHPDWLTLHTRFLTDPPQSATVGDTYKQEIKLLGRPGKAKWTVATIEPPSTLQLDGTAPMGVKALYRMLLEPIDGGTKVTLTMEFSAAILKGPLGAQVEKGTKAELDTSLSKLRDLANGSVA